MLLGMEKITGIHGVVEIRYFIRTFIVFGVNDIWFEQVFTGFNAIPVV